MYILARNFFVLLFFFLFLVTAGVTRTPAINIICIINIIVERKEREEGVGDQATVPAPLPNIIDNCFEREECRIYPLNMDTTIQGAMTPNTTNFSFGYCFGIAEGDTVGEYALLYNQLRTVTLIATKTSQVLGIAAEQFQQAPINNVIAEHECSANSRDMILILFIILSAN